MRALVVGASEESIHAIKLVRSMGYEVVALDGSPDAKGLASADERHVVDISDAEAILPLFDQPPDFIVPVPVGRVLVTTGRLNDHWGLPGVGLKAATLCTDKYQFSKALSSEGLRAGKCMLEDEIELNPGMVDTLRFPVVAKPRFGSGSRGVRLASSASDLLAFLSKRDDVSYIVEEAFEGDEYGLDGIVHKGRLSVLLLRRKVNTLPPACQCIGYQTVAGMPQLYASVQKHVQKAVRVLGLEEALVHADLMIRGEAVFIVEISARPSGHYIHNQLLPLALGIDPIETFVNVCVRQGGMPRIDKRRSLYMGFFGFDDCIVGGVPARSEIESAYDPLFYEVNFEEGDRLGPVRDGSVIQRGRFILEGQAGALPVRARDLVGEFKLEKTVCP